MDDFIIVCNNFKESADENTDGKVSTDEWVII